MTYVLVWFVPFVIAVVLSSPTCLICRQLFYAPTLELSRRLGLAHTYDITVDGLRLNHELAS